MLSHEAFIVFVISANLRISSMHIRPNNVFCCERELRKNHLTRTVLLITGTRLTLDESAGLSAREKYQKIRLVSDWLRLKAA